MLRTHFIEFLVTSWCETSHRYFHAGSGFCNRDVENLHECQIHFCCNCSLFLFEWVYNLRILGNSWHPWELTVGWFGWNALNTELFYQRKKIFSSLLFWNSCLGKCACFFHILWQHFGNWKSWEWCIKGHSHSIMD